MVKAAPSTLMRNWKMPIVRLHLNIEGMSNEQPAILDGNDPYLTQRNVESAARICSACRIGLRGLER
jgi:hypothetical protein